MRPATIVIPGPLPSFLRMSAISALTPPAALLSYLAQNIFLYGYSDGQPTEHLILLERYLRLAGELQQLAGRRQRIEVRCGHEAALLKVLGYRAEGGCGPGLTLAIADRDRAYLTVDSGFPLTQLTEDLRRRRTFTLAYAPTPVPVLFSAQAWSRLGRHHHRHSPYPVLDSLLGNVKVARLYAALAAMDPATASALERSPGLHALLPHAGVLQFYGAELVIRNGRVLVPGGLAAAPAWRKLTGASPASPADFVRRLVARDHGWLAAYYDDLARLDPRQGAYFTAPARLLAFYHMLHRALPADDAFRYAARHSMRPDANLFLLLHEQVWRARDEPLIPGGVSLWRAYLARQTGSKVERRLAAQARAMQTPEDVLAGLIAFSRLSLLPGPVPAYLALEDIDRERTPGERLNPATAALLLRGYARFGNEYGLFAEFPALGNAAITRYLRTAATLNQIAGTSLRANAAGIFQAISGLWQILARQHEIPAARQEASFERILAPFAHITSNPQLFAAGREALIALTAAAGVNPGSPPRPPSQARVIDLLAGPRPSPGSQSAPEAAVRRVLAGRIAGDLASQQLVPLDTLFALDGGLRRMLQGGPASPDLLPLARVLRDFELPQPILQGGVRAEITSHGGSHALLQTHTDLTGVIRGPSSPARLTAAIGRLTPFLRDTLVGLNYAYYAPPGGALLASDPLLVRLHDFRGAFGDPAQAWQRGRIVRSLLPGGGGVHLSGSLANLPYVLAAANQDFIVPAHTQSLIWQDAVPTLLTGAIVPRWWNVSPRELRAAALYQQAGDELLNAARDNRRVRREAVEILTPVLLPRQLARLEASFTRERDSGPGDPATALPPAKLAYLAAAFRRRDPGAVAGGAAGRELAALVREDPGETSWRRIEADFGMPHPASEDSYALALAVGKPGPVFLDYSSRLLAEGWESNNLYWARLAYAHGDAPAALNLLVPALTLRMIANIAASNIGDWPALGRALRATGAEFTSGSLPLPALEPARSARLPGATSAGGDAPEEPQP